MSYLPPVPSKYTLTPSQIRMRVTMEKYLAAKDAEPKSLTAEVDRLVAKKEREMKLQSNKANQK